MLVPKHRFAIPALERVLEGVGPNAGGSGRRGGPHTWVCVCVTTHPIPRLRRGVIDKARCLTCCLCAALAVTFKTLWDRRGILTLRSRLRYAVQ